MLPSWRTVRVYISSTFRDTQAERDWLVKVVFPALRDSLEDRRIHLIDVDLRWGITAAQAEQGLVLDLCSREIDSCRPFFIGILGERYGWVPDTHGTSVTDLEMHHAVLNHPPDGAAACFYLRDPAFLDELTDDQRTVFVEGSAASEERLRALKQTIRSRTDLAVYDNYPCRWDPGATDPYTRRKGRVVGLESFGERVRSDLERTILGAPELADHLDPQRAPLPDRHGLYEESEHHDRFVESRLRFFVERSPLQAQLLRAATGTTPDLFLLTGSAGSGKSTLLARLVRDVRAQHPDVALVAHFVGASPHSTSLRSLLRRLSLEVQAACGVGTEPPSDLPDLIEYFGSLLEQVPETVSLVFVIDALNQLDDVDGAHKLLWLPQEWPRSVRWILSCTDQPGGEKGLISAFETRPHQRLALPPLDDAERLAIIQRAPSLWAKTLDHDQQRRLLHNPATHNPLFLVVALEELRGYGSYDTLTSRIDAFPNGPDATVAIFGQVLERLEWDGHLDVTRDALALLGTARHGLVERELQDLLSDGIGPGHNDALFIMLRQLRPYLLSRGTHVDVAHRTLLDAIRGKYLPESVAPSYHLRLAEYFRNSPDETRRIEDCPWHLSEGQHWNLLSAWLSEPATLARAWRHDKYAVRSYWARIEARTDARMAAAYAALLGDSSLTLEEARTLASLLDEMGLRAESAALWRTVVPREREHGTSSSLATALGHLADVQLALGDSAAALSTIDEALVAYTQANDQALIADALGTKGNILAIREDLDGALGHHREAERIGRLAGRALTVQAAIENQAGVLQRQGRYLEALELHRQSEALCRDIGDWDNLQVCLGNQGVIHRGLRDYGKALQLFREAGRISRMYGNLHGVQRALGNEAEVLDETGSPADSLRIIAERQRLCRSLGNPRELAAALMSGASTAMRLDEYAAAETALLEAEQVARAGGERHILAKCLTLCGLLKLRLGREQEAEALFEEAGSL